MCQVTALWASIHIIVEAVHIFALIYVSRHLLITADIRHTLKPHGLHRWIVTESSRRFMERSPSIGWCYKLMSSIKGICWKNFIMVSLCCLCLLGWLITITFQVGPLSIVKKWIAIWSIVLTGSRVCKYTNEYYVFHVNQARGYLQSLPQKTKIPWNKLYPSADPKGLLQFSTDEAVVMQDGNLLVCVVAIKCQ